MSAAVRAERTGPRHRPTARAAVLAALLTALLFYLAVPLRTYLSQRSQLAHLEQQNRVLEQQNGELQSQIRRLRDPAYLERIARECLGMVKPGEIGFVIVPSSGPGGPAPGC